MTLDTALSSSLDPTRRWGWATALFALFLTGVLFAANFGSPLLAFVRYLPGADFTGHVVLMGSLAFVAGCWASRPVAGGLLSRGAVVVALLVLVEELSQIWLIHRTFSLQDLAADALGIALAESLRRRLVSEASRERRAAPTPG